MKRPYPIYGPLVSGKSFFHHSSFLLNQRIRRETNWIFSTPAFNFGILIPVLTTAFLFFLNSTFVPLLPATYIVLIPALSLTTVFFFLQLTAQGFLLSQAVNKNSKLKTINIFINSFVLPFNITRGNRTLQPQLHFCINGNIIYPRVIK